MNSTPKHPIFNENCPRPPVPGEETDGGLLAPGHPPGYPPLWNFQKKSDSPVLTPRRSSLAAGSRHTTATLADIGAPLGFEPEGSCGGGDTRGRYPHEQPSPPPYMQWAQNLHYLLDDPEGVQLFQTFLKQEGQLDILDFWFACEGLKKQPEQAKIPQIIKAIHRKFIVKSQFAIPDDLRKEVNRQVKGGNLNHSGIFDGVQSAVEQLISQTTYPNFLKSDLYLQHVQSMQNGSSDNAESGSSSSSSRDPPGLGSGFGLPTLHEDSELSISNAMPTSMPAPLPLTKNMLMVTERRRATELKPKPEAYAGMFLQRPYLSPFLSHPNNPHVMYNSYNPVSRQDSELQSLSSDARTESDNLSLTDIYIDEKSSVGQRSSRHQHVRQCRQIKESASLNRDPLAHRSIIPRTHQKETQPLEPEVFAAVLINKLEHLKKELEVQEKLDRKLLENDMERVDVARLEPVSTNTASSTCAFADSLREKLQLEEDNDQDILDQHVSRVWSDQTPDRTPGFSSPRPKSPDKKRASAPSQESALPSIVKATGTVPPHPYQSRTSYSSRHLRKEKDVYSTFSGDSGNVHDYSDGFEHKHHVPKSKSVPDYGELKQEAHPDRDRDRHRDRDRDRDRERDRLGTFRRLTSFSSRKTLTDQTDSGVSVVSDRQPIPHPALGHGLSHASHASHASPGSMSSSASVPGVPAPQNSTKVLSWLLESSRDKQNSASARSESSSKHRVRDRERDRVAGTASATSPITSRHSRKSACALSGSANAHSRSDSLERGAGVGPLPMGIPMGVSMGMAPQQPFVGDPCMPLLPQPHTPTQLEEARRRLLDDGHRTRTRYSVGGKLESSHSNPSTLKRNNRPLSARAEHQAQEHTTNRPSPARAEHQAQEHTTVVLTFCDEQVPYRIRIPHQPVTLRQFKEFLPKKGNYRYFFKTECEELDMRAIQEEIRDDNDTVPLWDGKIMAQVKLVE